MGYGIQFFKTTPKSGRPVSINGFAEGIRSMAHALENISVDNGTVDWYDGAPIISTEGEVGWTGVIWFENRRVDILDDSEAEEPVLIGFDDQGNWIGEVKGKYLVVRKDGDVYESGESESLAYKFTNDFGDWDDEIEKAYQVAELIEGEEEQNDGYVLSPNTAGDIHLRDLFEVVGDPELFKAVTLVGWTLSEGEWTKMSYEDMVANPPEEIWTGQSENGNYLRPTWDYIRAIPEEEEE